MAKKIVEEIKDEINVLQDEEEEVVIADENTIVIDSKEEVIVIDEVKEPKKEVTLDLKEEVKADKMVKIVTNVNHRCCVGGEWYFFTKDEVQIVPQNVKNILREAGLLAPL